MTDQEQIAHLHHLLNRSTEALRVSQQHNERILKNAERLADEVTALRRENQKLAEMATAAMQTIFEN